MQTDTSMTPVQNYILPSIVSKKVHLGGALPSTTVALCSHESEVNNPAAQITIPCEAADLQDHVRTKT